LVVLLLPTRIIYIFLASRSTSWRNTVLPEYDHC
jgi:hypothetical protein